MVPAPCGRRPRASLSRPSYSPRYEDAAAVGALRLGQRVSHASFGAGVVMATFALGTTPGLLALAGVPEVATGRSRDTVLRVVGVVVIAFALLNSVGGLRLLGYTVGTRGPSAAVVASTAAATPKISSNVTLANGLQTVHMTQEPRGYVPADTVVYAGIPIT